MIAHGDLILPSVGPGVGLKLLKTDNFQCLFMGALQHDPGGQMIHGGFMITPVCRGIAGGRGPARKPGYAAEVLRCFRLT